MIKKNIVGTVTELVSPVAEEMDIILWDVEFVKEGAKKILRITIDSEEGIDINLCEKFHRTIDPMLDEADPIDESYYLEVTSPGIEREIKTDAHIAMCEGEKVEIKLYAPKNGSKSFTGTLVGLNDESKVVIAINGENVEFEKNEIAKMHTVFDF
ncbi:MAG: ribosome maturation factor RimP [Clostridia bacterium]|nr:ribosome maturation factor RimP [Clostridia bacterium]